MKPAGYFLMLTGVLVAVLGMAQLAWVILTSPDPNPNPVGNGMLMVLCWFIGVTLIGVGGWMAGVLRPPLV
jgi:hypothetical protein